jgi:N-acetylglucosaminyldiphosphoundecaprenol N-acetyl-beta-D-mannosaminyltransferase
MPELPPKVRRNVSDQRVLMFGLRLDPLTMEGVLDRCREALRTRTRLLIGVVNAAKIVSLGKDEELRSSLLDCDLIVADGQSVVWASRLLRKPLPTRVAGIDLFEELLRVAEAEGHAVYLLGAQPTVLEVLQTRLRELFPGLRIAGARDGYFGAQDNAAVAATIRDSGADMLFLGMTSPKKEIFLRDWGSSLGVPVLHGVGGSFDVFAGVTKRAPATWQRLGLEWAYRLVQEPRRMWRRYLTTNTAFIALTIRERLRPRPAFTPRPTTEKPGAAA